MIYYNTYFDKEVKDEIVEALGDSYGIKDLLKLGSVGSSRMRISAYSPAFKPLIESNSDFAVASIALRPKGILVTVSKNYKNICWAIPYYRLSVYKTDVLSIHANGQFLKLQLQQDQNKRFIAKLLEHKLQYSSGLGA